MIKFTALIALLVTASTLRADAFVPSQTCNVHSPKPPFGSSRRQDVSPAKTTETTTALFASTMDNEIKKKTNDNNNMSMGDRLANSGMASAAAMATAAVNAAVSMKTLEAPDVDKSYISLDKTQNELDEEGLPLVYDKDLIQAYWSKERGALNKRWGYFVGKAVPFLTKLTTLFIRDGKISDEEIPALSRQARMDLQDLGPTFIKVSRKLVGDDQHRQPD
jgi:hypothetical protein